jgi:hypothetical protein
MDNWIMNLLASYGERIGNGKTPVKDLRELYTQLVNGLSRTNGAEEFAIGLLYKGLVQDVLSNFVEDDYIERSKSREILSAFAATLGCDQRPSEKQFDSLRKFAEVYMRVGGAKIRADITELRHADWKNEPILALVAGSEGNEFNIGDAHDFKVFPSLDINICDPKIGKRVEKMYLQKLRRVRADLRRKGEELDWLCFVEKSYSVVGAVTLVSRLVSSMGIPACIYRAGYWNLHAKLSGKMPTPKANVCIIYDMILGGDAVLDAARFLKETCDAHAQAVIVFFEYDGKGGEDKLKSVGREILGNDHGVRLYSLLRLSNVRPHVDRVVELYSEINHYGNTVEDLEERVSLISRAVEKYVLSTQKATK